MGGEGTRLRPLTLTVPKQMLPVVEQPMIERVVGHLADHGIDEAVLSLGYRPDAFINSYPSGSIDGVRLSYAVEPTPLDTAGAIRFAAAHAGVDETFVVVNGDVLTDSDISELIAFHRRSGAEATISLTPVDDPSSFGVVVTDDGGRVEAFIEKPPRDEVPTNLINAGTYVMEPSVLARIPSDRRASVERETFPALVEEGPCSPWVRRPTGWTPAPPMPISGPIVISSWVAEWVRLPRCRSGPEHRIRGLADWRRRRAELVGGTIPHRSRGNHRRRRSCRGFGGRC